MTAGKLQSWFWTNIEQQKYITNNPVIKSLKNNSNSVNSAEQRLQKILKQICENIKKIKNWK